MMKWVAPRAARPQRGALFTIAALLIGSAVLRIGLTASEAIALEKSHTPSEVKASSDTACETVGDLDGMLVAFREREERIATQELKCPSSYKVGHQIGLSTGGSGSFV